MAENRFRVRKSKVEDILFDTTITPIDQVEGLMQWNETDGTLDLTLQGGTVTQQIGQELLVKCRNDSDAPIETERQYTLVVVKAIELKFFQHDLMLMKPLLFLVLPLKTLQIIQMDMLPHLDMSDR
jgi:hypothetical protein